jgi:uncharacterized damage-inducible protein DinB
MADVASTSFVLPLEQCLLQLADLIDSLSNEQYSRPFAQPQSKVQDSPIGAHVRHILDHVAALTHGLASGTITYDQRQRGTAVETDRQAGLEQINSLIQALSAVRPEMIDRQVKLIVVLDPDQPDQTLDSTIGREVAFVLSHSIHHNAIIRALVEREGVHTPKWFGYAPATVQYQKQVCAQSPS